MLRHKNNWPEHLTIGVLKVPGVETPEVVKKWTQMLAQDTGMQVNMAYSTDNTKAAKFRWLHYGVVDIADGGGLEFRNLLEGNRQHTDRDTGPFQLRLVWNMSRYDSGFIVRGDSYIKNVYDIKPGVRVVDTRGYLASQSNIEGLLAWAKVYDLEKDVRWVKAYSSEEKAQLIVDGKADVAFGIPTAEAIIRSEKNPYGIRWLDLNSEEDPEGARRFNEKCRLIGFGPMFRRAEACGGVWGNIGIDQFCCHADTNPDLIYNLAKWINENWNRYKGLHPWLVEMNLNNLMAKLDVVFIPCHDGLIKYLKELGLWTEAHEKRHKANVELVTQYCEASQKAMQMADEKGIEVFSKNPEWIQLWENYKRDVGLPIFDYLPNLGKAKQHN